MRTTISCFGGKDKYWIGLAGAPGSGKSTLASQLQTECDDLLTVIPMDGYHFYRRELDAMGDPVEAHARRGAPFTFNAERFVDELITAKASGAGSFPGFDHGVGDPVEGQIVLDENSGPIVLVEGNYLLLDDERWCRLRSEVFDETWYLDTDIEICKRRVYERHLRTGKTEAEAQWRIDHNDGPMRSWSFAFRRRTLIVCCG